MATLLYFILYLGAALIVAAQLFYPVYQLLDTHWEIRPDRVYYRLAMVIAIIGFWPFLKILAINNRYALGYALDRWRFLRSLALGLAIGVAIMAVHAIMLVMLGVRVIEFGDGLLNSFLHALMSGLLSGILVAFIEETFFRGAMQYNVRYNNTFLLTAIITSLLYAAVHFIHPLTPTEGTVIGWHSGMDMLAGMLHQYENFAGFIDSYIALVCAGLFLSLIRERSGHIALCIGIHAGWVMAIKVTQDITSVAAEAPTAFLIGSYDSVIGWGAAGVLAAVTLLYWWYGNNRKTSA